MCINSSKYLGVALALFLVPTICNAMPARRSTVLMPGPDGTEIRVRQYGDENFHYYIAEDDGSLMILQGDTLFHADLTGDGRLKRTNSKIDAFRAVSKYHAMSKAQNRISGIVEGTTFPAIGKQKVAVVLVEYQDVKFNLENPLDYFTRMLNEEGFSDYHATGSARDWFIYSSGGLFEPEFDVYGPITLQQRREYYGGSDAYNHDRNPQRMVIEACRQLNAEVDFTQYDRDNDGFIDNVFVVYAGRGEASGGSSDCVWPHAWKLSNAEPGNVYSFDGVRLDRYACSNEWELSDLGYGYRPVGIGTFVHEFSHVMGLPDLYSTDYISGSFTAGAWSAMDYGPYNNDGCTPPQYSAWERAALGYIDIPNIEKGSVNVALEPLEKGGARLIPTENADEFFIIENRQQYGWDEFVPGHGMLLWHIDYNADAWRTNTINNDPLHNRVDIIEADGTQTESSRNGDCFPGASEVTSLNSTTTPALKSWSGKDLGISISNISERNGNVLIRINGGAPDIATPQEVTTENLHAGYFDVKWMPVANSKGYTVRVYNEAFAEIAELVAASDDVQLTVTGLEPSTDYVVTVCAEDGLYGSLPSIPLAVRTLDPTFDYFAPTALSATELQETAFTAHWEEMKDAKEYFVTVYKQDDGDIIETATGFDNGAEDLPEGWLSNSKASYGMASYSGASVPSLRLSKDGDYLEMDCNGKRGQKLTFWHRGNGTGANETLSVLAFAEESLLMDKTFAVISEKGGATLEIELPDVELSTVRIVFNRPEKGALAIDDVCLSVYDDYILNKHEAYDGISAGNRTSLFVSGLTPGATYFYDVYAFDGGEYTSLRSNLIKVDLSDITGVDEISEGLGFKVHDLTIESNEYLEIYDICGRLILKGNGILIVPTPGIYIIKSNYGSAHKLIITNR